jgi:tetratricopeptide (TPR) repeat protein
MRGRNFFNYVAQFIWLILIPIEGIFLLHVSHGQDGWIVLNLSAFVAFLYLSVVPHELGHALAAVATGSGGKSFRLGAGPPLGRWTLNDTLIELNWPTISGGVIVRSKDIHFQPLRYFLFIAGGPAANLVLVLLTLAVAPRWNGPEASLERPQMLWMLALANLYLLVWNLLPVRPKARDGRRVSSDGLQILRLIRGVFSPQKSRAEAHVKRAAQWLTEGEPDRALADYAAALELDPDCALAFCDRGVAYSTKGDRIRAIADYDQAIRLDPQLTAAIRNRALAYYHLGDYAKARADFDQVVERGEASPEIWCDRGNARLHLGELDGAIADFDQALRRKPKLALAVKSRAAALQRQDKPERALADLTEALRLAPNSAESYVNRGIALAQLARYEPALADFEHAIRLAPDSPWGFYNYAFTCALQGRDALALSYFEQALAVAPDMAKALYGRGLMRLRLGQGEGTADLARADAAEPDTRAYFAQYGLSVPAGMDYTA